MLMKLDVTKIQIVFIFLFSSLFLVYKQCISLQLRTGKNSTTIESPSFLWATKAGGYGSDFGEGVVTDAEGNIFVTGSFEGTAFFGSITLTSGDHPDVFIAKCDPSGNFLWVKQFGDGVSIDEGLAIAIDPGGNLFITGSLGKYIFTAKCDPSGNFLWFKKASVSSWCSGKAITVDGFGDVIVTGSFRGWWIFFDSIELRNSNDNTSYDNPDVFVVKYDGITGKALWAHKIGGFDIDEGLDVATDDSSYIYVTGSIVEVQHRDSNAFIAKYDSSGNVVWFKSFGSRALRNFEWRWSEVGKSISCGSDYVFIAGNYRGPGMGIGNPRLLGSDNIFIAKFNPSGHLVWAKQAGGTFQDKANCIAKDKDGNLLITGFFSYSAVFDTVNLSSGSDDAFIAQYDSLGNILWAKQSVSTTVVVGQRTRGSSITVDNVGNIIITGSFPGTVSFGNFAISSAGFTDIFLVKLGSDVTTSVGQFPEFANSFVLLQNYPNPFNPSTTISYQIPNSVHVLIEIYNVLGQKVATLVDNKQSSGHYQIQWDGKNQTDEVVASGIYILRFFTTEFVQTKKLLLFR